MTWTYRNRDTGQVVELAERSPRLDRLAYRWELVGQPEPEVEVEVAPEPELEPPAEPVARPRPSRRRAA